MLNLGDVKAVIVDDRPDLKFTPYNARFPERIRDFGGDCFAAIRAKDIVVHHPYESFDVVVQFLRQAARDPDVVAIKQTLYRTSARLPDRRGADRGGRGGQDGHRAGRAQGALRRGGQHPLGARPRARRRAGGLRLHRAQDPRQGVDGGAARGRRRSAPTCHFGTGNYHPITARIYTDLSFFTCDPAMGRDAARLFNYMTGYARPEQMEKIAFAPVTLRSDLYDADRRRDRQCARRQAGGDLGQAQLAGRPADHRRALRRLARPACRSTWWSAASAACAPACRASASNIRVKSIVGRFLEHARIVCFGNGKALPSAKAKVFISSADWMPRNLDRRVELLCPVENPTVHEQVLDQIMVANLKDDGQSWIMEPDGTYVRPQAGQGTFHRPSLFHDQPVAFGPRQRAAAERRGAATGSQLLTANGQRRRAAAKSSLQSRPVSARGSAHGRRTDHRRPAPRQGRLGPGRVGIIDVGSNSIRLVVYERASRAPLPVFNEKVLCGLARGLDATGRLNPARRRDGARQHRPLHHARPQHEGDVARPAGDGGGARRLRRAGIHARAREPAGHQGAYRERPGRGALFGLRRDVRHARRLGRHGRPGRRQPRTGGARTRPHRRVDRRCRSGRCA